MNTDIILAGVGGQGILSIAAAIGFAALEEGLYIKQAEVHGMSQRGGQVQSHVRISDKPIASDLIPYQEADLILSVEPLESLRYLPYLNKEGWLVSNADPLINIDNYPDIARINANITKLSRHILFHAKEMAAELNAPKSVNMIMLGAGSPFIQLSPQSLKKGIRKIFESKGADIVDKNILAFEKGRSTAISFKEKAAVK